MKKKLYKKLLILLVLIYVVFTFISQQKVLNQYNANSKELASQIKEQESKKKDLIAEKDNVNSKEYIDMYYPNEKIYIDKGM